MTPLRSRIVNDSHSSSVNSVASCAYTQSYSVDITLIGLSMPPIATVDPFVYRYAGGSRFDPPWNHTDPSAMAWLTTSRSQVFRADDVNDVAVFRMISPRIPGLSRAIM